MTTETLKQQTCNVLSVGKGLYAGKVFITHKVMQTLSNFVKFLSIYDSNGLHFWSTLVKTEHREKSQVLSGAEQGTDLIFSICGYASYSLKAWCKLET